MRGLRRSKQRPQRAEPAQHGCHEASRQRTISVAERLEAKMGIKLFVERPPSQQDAVDQFRGDLTRAEALYVRLDRKS